MRAYRHDAVGESPVTGAPPREVNPARRRLGRRDFLRAGLSSLGLAVAAGCESTAAHPHRPVALGRAYSTLPGVHAPALTMVKPARGVSPGFVLLSPNSGPGYEQGMMLLDSSGQLVWFQPLKQRAENLQLQQYEGRPCLTWWEGDVILPGYGSGSYVIVDDTYRVVRRVMAVNGLMGDLHEFILTPEGTALFTAYETRSADLSAVGGPKNGILLDSLFQEVDLTSGRLLMQWRASDHVALEESYVKPWPQASRKWDFFHINSIDVDSDGNLLVSGRHTWTVYKIDRSTGSVLWRLGGKRSDFAFETGAAFSWQHHVRHHPGGTLSIFDNGAGLYKTEKHSRGIVISLDLVKKTASLLREYLPDPSVLASSQGSVQLLDDGHVFIGWGAEPYFSEYDANGTIIFDERLPLPCHSYRAFKADWVGRPTTLPAVVAVRTGTDRVTVKASWNGATEVARWDVLAGAGKTQLSRLATFSRVGFETAMELRTRARFVRVAALARDGSVLARSEAVRVAKG